MRYQIRETTAEFSVLILRPREVITRPLGDQNRRDAIFYLSFYVAECIGMARVLIIIVQFLDR